MLASFTWILFLSISRPANEVSFSLHELQQHRGRKKPFMDLGGHGRGKRATRRRRPPSSYLPSIRAAREENEEEEEEEEEEKSKQFPYPPHAETELGEKMGVIVLA